ncbi:MAG: hypothetical protein ACFCA4_18800, partial [Cyanophyceae cyanobacterium]
MSILLATALIGSLSLFPSPKAAPLCYFDYADGTREDLSALCGGTPSEGSRTVPRSRAIASESDAGIGDNESPNFSDYTGIRVGSSGISEIERELGEATRGRSLNRGGGRSTETAYEWTSPSGNRLGVLALEGRVTAKVYRSRFPGIEQLSFAGIRDNG